MEIIIIRLNQGARMRKNARAYVVRVTMARLLLFDNERITPLVAG